MGTNRRVLILADSDNTFLAAQSFNRRLDWQKVRDYLADPDHIEAVKQEVASADLSCHAFKLGTSSEQDARTTRLSPLLILKFKCRTA
ncbi:MAG: hypothetical protein RLP02_02230 [Coleofasciculus sp. C2-GNP5-27]